MDKRVNSSGKTALITGGASGLGLAMADELARHGVTPLLIDITPTQTPYELEIADVSNAASLASAVVRLTKKYGPIDLAIANAAVDLTGEAHTFTQEDWRKIIETNLIGATNLISAVYPDMIERKSGQFILIASGAGLVGFPLGAPYTASKAGLIGLGKALRAEAARYGVKVNVACPPILATPLLGTGRAKPGIDRPRFIASLQKAPMPAQKAARNILQAAGRNKSPIIFPVSLAIGHKLSIAFPKFGETIRKRILTKFDKFGRK